MNNPTYLVHHGIKGQKWGVRRFQNADGSRTEAGKRRRGTKEGTVDDLNTLKKTIDETNKIINNVANRKSNKKNPRLDLTSMTDKELRDRINRELLERQYNDIFNARKKSKGEEFADRLLKTAPVVLTSASSILSIMVLFKKLEK